MYLQIVRAIEYIREETAMTDKLIDSTFPHFDLNIPKLSIPSVDANIFTSDLFRDHSLADRQYELLCEYIKTFQDNLDNEHEICLKLTSFGQSITLQVTDIGYANPSIITFSGYVNGQYCELIQHITQLNFLLMACEKSEPEKPPRRIGFNSTDV